MRAASKIYSLLVLFTILFSPVVFSQTPSVSPIPDQNEFPAESFCIEAPLINTGNPGFGPYLQLIVPDGLIFDSASLFGSAITPINAGVFPPAPGNQVDDTIISQPVTGPEGDTLYLLQPPIGSVVDGGPPLNIEICFIIDPAAPVNVPMTVSVVPVFELGDTPTGDNGPIIGAATTFDVTPILVEFRKENTAPEQERPPGPSWPVTFSLITDVATGNTIDNIIITDIFPANFVLDTVSVTITGNGVGCVPTIGATLIVNCTSVTGTGANDIIVTYTGYYDDVLDETNCSTAIATNNASFDGVFAGNAIAQETDTNTNQIEHLSIQKSVAPSVDVSPGDTVTFSLAIQLTDFGTANNLQLQDILDDGYTFVPGSETFSGGAITATVTDDTPANGETTLDFDLSAITGNINGGTGLTLTYQATVDAAYFNGDPILASDSLTNSIVATYGLTAGAANCTDNSSASVDVIPVAISKSVISAGPYQPGDTVTYRLTMDVPSGDTNNVVFTDFFPLPVFVASTVSTVFGVDIIHSPVVDTIGLIPTAITIDAATNSLIINWPNINTTMPQTISVDINIDVTTDPFADNLSLSNLLQVSTENTGTITATAVAPVLILINAPELTVTKGVFDADQGTITPPPAMLPIDGNVSDVDAGDNITFVVTIENVGGALAHDVTITDPLLPEFTVCTVDSVLDGNGTVLATTGSLTAGMVLTNPLAVNDGTVGAPYADDTALVTYTCTLAANVTPEMIITNTASVTFASVGGGTTFPELSDDATTTISAPGIAKTIIDTAPDADGDDSTVTIGETIQYQVVLTMQEGLTPLSSLIDNLDAGLLFQSFDSIVATAGLTSSHGAGFADVLLDATGIGTATATFPFDSITNSDTTNATIETITITYTVIVDDVGFNNNGDTRNNSATLGYDGGSVNAGAPNVTIIEPNLTINKTVNPTSADAGDVVTYTMVITNSGTSTAYDTVITDDLASPFLNLDVGSVTTSSGAIILGNTAGDTTVQVDVPTIAAAASVTITFTVTLDASTPSGASIINTGSIDSYSSLPGGNGRPYGPTTDTATIAASAAVVTKSTLPATSSEQSGGVSGEGNGALVDLTIGEEVTFEIVATLAEGVSPSVIITDTLPNNATGHMDVVSATVISVGGNLTATNPAPPANIAPPNVVSFDFGSVTNAADGTVDNNDQIVIQVTAIVRDNPVNGGLEVLTNNVIVQYNTGLTASSSSDVEIVEPRLSIVKSSPTTTADAGDTITFTITIANTNAGNSNANAFDVDLADIIPTDYTYLGGSLTLVSGPAADAGTLIENAGTIEAHWTQFDLGQTAVITYQVTVDNTVAPQQNITNTADINWTSMPGANADERTGTTSESHTVTITTPGVSKVVFSTSEPSSGTAINGPEDDLVIGEEVTYRFTVTIPEGTSAGAIAVDQLPTVSTILDVVSSQVVSIGGQLTVPGAIVGQAGVATDTDADTFNDNVEWLLGDVFNMPDGINNTDDQIVFEVVAILVDQAPNQSGGNDIINTATFTTGANSSSGTALIDIIEPVINVTKATVPASITADAGDVLDYRITLTHDAASNSDAFNFTVTDVLPTPGTIWINDGTVSSTCGVVTTDSSGTPTIVFTFSSLPLASTSCIIDYQVQVDVGVNPNDTYQNTVTTTYTSTAVINSETRIDTDMASTSFITPDPAIVKVTAGSSLADTGDNVGDMLVPDLAIGEEIDFTLTIILPEGTTTNAVVVDTLPLPLSGGVMEVVSATIDSLGANLTSSLPGTPVITDSDADTFNDTVTFDFGTVVNTPDGLVNTDDHITITVTAVVLDEVINSGLETLTNNATFTYGPGTVLSDTADIEIVEPILSLAKSMGPMVDHVVPITLTFENTGDAPAYDIVIEDILDAAVFDVATIVEVTTPAGFTFAATVGGVVTYVSDVAMSPPDTSIEPGEVLVFIFNVTLRDDVVLPDTILNTATLTEASSLPGNDPNERDLSDIVANGSLPLPLLDSEKSSTLVADTNGSGAASPGEELEYTITIVNSGAADATNVLLSDVPDANVSLNVGSVTTTHGVVTTGNNGGDTMIDITIPTIPVGETVVVVYRVTINNPLAEGVDDLTNQGLISSDETPDLVTDDPSTGPDDDPTVVPVDGAPDLVVTKDDGGVTAVAGGVVVFTINYSNIGTQDATGVVITETVPINSIFDAVNSTGIWTCLPDNNAGSTCTQNIGDVNAGDPIATVDFAVTVDLPIADGETELLNNVSIADDGNNGADLDNGNNSDSDTTPLSATPDLQIVKDDGGVSTTPGGTLVYTLTYTNVGGQDATGVVITDVVPANSTFDPGSSAAGWVCVPDNSAGSTCTNTIGNVSGNGGTGSIDFAVIIDNPLATGVTSLSNTASIADDGSNGVDPTPGDNSSSDTTPIDAAPDMAIAKTDNGVSASPGDTITYDISYDNVGNQNATGVVITETVPDNTVYNPGASSAGWNCVPDGNPGSTCTLLIGNVPVGGGAIIQFAVDIDNPLDSGVLGISNVVTIGDDGTNGPDPDPSNNVGSDTTPLGSALPDLTITKDDGGVTVAAGDTIIYVINYANVGNQTSTGVEITETVPANTQFNPTASTAGWVCTPDINAGSTCLFIIASLAGGGASGSIDFAVDVDNPLAAGVTTINNSVSITDDGNNGPDLNPGDNDDNDTTPVTGAPDLTITKVDQSDIVNVGGTIIYDITYANIGSQDATGVVITETVPQYTTFNASSSSGGWSCAPDNNAGATCLFNVGALTVDQGITTIQFAVDVDATLPAGVDSISNTISIADDGSNGVDPDPSNNTDPEDTNVGAFPDLAISKTDNDVTSGPGQTIVYTLDYENLGNQNATGVVINETVPANTSYNAAASSVVWVCTPDNLAGSACQYTIGALAAGDSGSVTFAVDVDDPLAAGVNLVVNSVNIADDGANGGDSDPSNNNAIDDTSLQLAPPVGLKIGEFDSADPRVIHWTFWWFNPNNDRDLPVFIFDEIPAGTTFIGNASCTANGTSSCTTPTYNAALNRLELSAIIGEDENAAIDSLPDELDNEIVISFDLRVNGSGPISVINQAMANWDENNDGDPNDDANSGQNPIPTDDPVTSALNDPTRLGTVFPIPTLNIWSLLLLILAMISINGLYLRSKQI